MKRIGLVCTWFFFMLGIPTSLTLGRFAPLASLVGIRSNLSDGNWERCLLYVTSAILWLIWTYGLVAFVIDIWRLKYLKNRSRSSFGFRRWTALSAATVWSLMFTSNATAFTSFTETEVATLEDSRPLASKGEIKSIDLSSPTPLALSASTIFVTGMLKFVHSRRQNVLRESAPHSRSHALSQRSQSTLKELQLSEEMSNSDGIRYAVNYLMGRERSPILASWRPSSTPRAVIHRSTSRIASPPLCCVPLGLLDGEVILLTLSQGEVISVHPDQEGTSRSVIAHLAHSIILETIGSGTNVIAYGFSEFELINAPHLSIANSIKNLIEQVTSNGSAHSIVVCSVDSLSEESVKQLRNFGCCLIMASIDPEADVALIQNEHGWIVQPTKQLVSLYGLSVNERTAVSRLASEVSRPTAVPSVVGHLPCPIEWRVIVRMLGPVEVMTREGKSIRFEKSKSIELLAWLTTHRSRQSRSAARTALWEVNVQDASFTNVVSDVRRNLERASPLLESEEWLARTLTDALPLHESVTTDIELLDASIRRGLSIDSDSALMELRDALEYVRDLPFSGTNYLWTDSEGITTQLTLSVMTSAVMASELYLERGDTEGVFWATGRGLKVLPGHEELLGLRMRAHALKGDLAAVRAEWSSHQRAISRDVWSGGATSPKLDDLCRSLLQATRQGAYSGSE
ncbi:MAG: hypothetical protein ABI590_03045 [Ilumatobacteraceae bacterium]